MTAKVSLEQQNLILQKINEQLNNKISYLEEQLEWFKKQIFGKRSEKVIDDSSQQLTFEFVNEMQVSEQKEKQVIPAHERTKPNRNGQDSVTLPCDIPVERKVLDLPEEEKVCPETGKPLVKIGEEVTCKLAYKPGNYYVKEIVRPKYALPQGEGIRIAELPESFLPKCKADESLLADILTKKYADHLPLYRICEDFARNNIGISRQLLSQWVLAAGKGLKLLYEEMVKQILKSNNIFIDESPVDVQSPGKVHQAYMWLVVGGLSSSPPYRAYFFKMNRQHKNVQEIIGNYQGVLHSDKYGAYVNLASQKQIVWCPCFSHIRRNFFEIESGDLEFKNWVLRKIRYLFMFEKVAWARSPGERLQIRSEKEVPIIDELIQAIKEKLIEGKILPKSKMKEALGYFCSLIPYLKNYTNHPYARLDNNVAERALRPLAIGRKNWLFMGSEKGGEAAAIILSLVQTCRGLNINPREYLEDILRKIMGYNSQKLYELLPDQWLERRNKCNMG